MCSSGNHCVFKRRWERIPIQLPVDLAVYQAALVDRINASGSELNEGGMCLLAFHEMRMGIQVAVEFTPPLSDDSLRLWATVRSRHGYHYGLEFLAKNAMQREQVQRYCDALRVLRAAT